MHRWQICYQVKVREDYVVFLSNNKRKVCPLVWSSKTIRGVVRSTLAAETSAMIDALDAANFMSQVLTEMISTPKRQHKHIQIHALTDNLLSEILTRQQWLQSADSELIFLS